MRRVVELRRDWGRLDSAVARDELRMLLGTFGHRPCGAGPVGGVWRGSCALVPRGAQVVSAVGRLERGLVAAATFPGWGTPTGIDRLRRSPGV